jgi:hypothetical protein
MNSDQYELLAKITLVVATMGFSIVSTMAWMSR